MSERKCSFCDSKTVSILNDFDEIGWSAAKIKGWLKVACPEHTKNLKEWMLSLTEVRK